MVMEESHNIPEQILDWLKNRKFEQLSETEKTTVLQYMTEQNYAAMHIAYQKSSHFYGIDNNLQPAARIKQNLDEAFLKRHKAKPGIFSLQIEIWKAAAVLLIMLGFTLLFSRSGSVIQGKNATVLHDTLYQEKTITNTVYKTDTVVKYVTALQKTGSNKSNIIIKTTPKNTTNVYASDTDETIVPVTGFRTFNVADLKSNSIYAKGKPMKDDELSRHFAFARI